MSIDGCFDSAKAHKHSVLIHVNTVKGMGYRPAEKNPHQSHGIGKFDVNTGEPLSKGETFSSVFGNTGATTPRMPVFTAQRRLWLRAPD